MLKLTSFCTYSINGVHHSIPRGSIHNQIIQILGEISKHTITQSQFSSLVIQFTKREVSPGEETSDEFDQIIAQTQTIVREVNDSDFMPDYQNITWGEYIELTDDPIFMNMLRYIKSRDKSNYTESEIISIQQSYIDKYLHTKFHQIIQSIDK